MDLTGTETEIGKFLLVNCQPKKKIWGANTVSTWGNKPVLIVEFSPLASSCAKFQPYLDDIYPKPLQPGVLVLVPDPPTLCHGVVGKAGTSPELDLKC